MRPPIFSLALSLVGVALAGLVLAGCDAGVGPGADAGEADGRDPPWRWRRVASASFLADGESEALTLPAPGPAAALALRVSTEPGVCFQLSALSDGAGEVLIAERSAGAYCSDCSPRSAVAREAGVFMLDAEQVALAGADLSLRFAQVHCETLTPLRSPEERPALHLDALTIPAEREQAELDLRLLLAPDSLLFADEARQRALLAALADELLLPAGLSPRLVEVVALEAPSEPLDVHAGDHQALAALLEGAPPRAETTVDVVVAGCLRYADPIFGPPQILEGYTPRIPGGAGPADAVFLPAVDCLGPGEALTLDVEAQAHVLAHELGHYLGLYHAVEADGGEDPLDDTDADNIMHYRPGLAGARGFSPAQGRIMRSHPAVN
ncbi:hypothetical protein G6O69_06140 [Pseudenhygromyxa sp. WMMC2535]|uniref:M43 family zinc metalloprotease n=1 Tax=Pseudenhygromyxa sp. WMMC2535 TaxID=2712867 RepID=UPI001557F852|nr:M43 family zinc metalloprotease [Pseudenhygromyxa sp. WMMC2535]NVB37404.1 hypothetical protein [Pseudenhygromyxa sp. WMMC2535]